MDIKLNINYKEKLLSLPNQRGVNSPIGYLQDMHRTVRIFDENKPEDNLCLKALYENYDNIKARVKRK
jgi:hypothetical protein